MIYASYSKLSKDLKNCIQIYAGQVVHDQNNDLIT